MHAYFARKKPLIARQLRRLLELRGAELAHINGWGPDMVGRFLAFCLKGKMIRGGLLVLGWEMHARRRGAGKPRPTPHDVLQAAAAIEILHSSLLIHDDIMDNDRLRRGDRTIFAQYEQAGKRAGTPLTRRASGGPWGRAPVCRLLPGPRGAGQAHHGGAADRISHRPDLPRAYVCGDCPDAALAFAASQGSRRGRTCLPSTCTRLPGTRSPSP